MLCENRNRNDYKYSQSILVVVMTRPKQNVIMHVLPTPISFFSPGHLGELEKQCKELQLKMNKMKQMTIKAKKETENVKKKVKLQDLCLIYTLWSYRTSPLIHKEK